MYHTVSLINFCNFQTLRMALVKIEKHVKGVKQFKFCAEKCYIVKYFKLRIYFYLI